MILTTSLSILLSLFAAETLASPLHARSVQHEKRQSTPAGWIKGDRLRGDSVLPMRIGLKQQNLDKGHDLLMEVSSHDSPKYGKYYTAEEVTEIFAPSQDRVDSVSEWLKQNGIDSTLSTNKQWLQFDATAEDAEKLFKSEYYMFKHRSGASNIACDEYHLPEYIRSHVDYITPGIKLFASERRPSPPAEDEKRGVEKRHIGLPPILHPLPGLIADLLALPLLSLCNVAITPACIKAMYNITDGTTKTAGNELGIFEDLGDVYSQTDLDLFFTTLAQNIPTGTAPKLEAVDGAVAPVAVTSAGAESDLDFQISYPIIYPQNSILFQTDDPIVENDYTYEGIFNNFLDAIDGSYCNYSAFGETGNSPLDPPYPDPQTGGYKGQLQCGVYKPTNVISVSYGGQEADLPASYQQRQCNEYMKLGMQGISIVFASGDSGVAGPSGDDNTDGCLGSGDIFSPDFPASCPYLTTVGATYLPPTGNVFKDQETAVTRFGSGGGFSNIYAIPSYQSSAVAGYFANHTPPYAYYSSTNNNSFGANGGVYNRNGRGYPDVSAIGDNVVIFNQGLPTLIGGTSAAAPVFASILTRINEQRLAAGKSTVGFVNPVLYANPGVLHDITTGSNPGCGTNGFSASQGWDPVTGLGTPNFPAMLELFMGMP